MIEYTEKQKEKEPVMNLPSEFVSKMQRLLEEEWEAFAYCYEHHKYQALRLNPLKQGGTVEHRKEILKTLGILEWRPVPWAEYAFYYEEDVHPGKHPYHEAGLYYIQEPSAMSAAALLAPEPGERVLDLCAAPGGKSTQLASYLMQQGLLVANEIHPARCKILSQNIERMGIRNAIVTNEDSERLAEHFPEYFHKILVDAPCSGEGMFRKNPEAMEEWSIEQVLVCAGRQKEILDNAARMLLPGGMLVYSTCTFSPEENEGVIGDFLRAHEEFELAEGTAPWFDHGMPEWYAAGKETEGEAGAAEHADKVGISLKKTYRLFPHHLNGEGHFVAILHKRGNVPLCSGSVDTKGTADGRNGRKTTKRVLDKAQSLALEEFTSQTLSKETEAWILDGRLTLFGDQLYCLPENAPSLKGIRVLRAGLHIGTFKKNRFEPSHALALTLGEKTVKNVIGLRQEEERTAAYYRGEALSLEETDDPEAGNKGWCLVCVDGYSAGWGKLAGGKLKNHYPKGLRKEISGF